MDSALLALLPWLASRYDQVAGAFRVPGRAVEITTSQARAILSALGAESCLPYVVRAKLALWPVLPEADLARVSARSPLAVALARTPAGDDAAFRDTLGLFRTSDGGLALSPSQPMPDIGSMDAAYHLIVKVRPSWHRAHGRTVPGLAPAVLALLVARLVPANSC